jgi:hypothetical protein
LVRLCDTALDAEGELASLAPDERSSSTTTDAVDSDDEVWLMQLSADDKSSFRSMSRRQAVAVGAVSIAGMSISRSAVAPSTGADDTTLLGVSRSLFDQYRKLGQSIDPGLLLPTLIAQTHTLRELSAHSGARTRQGLLQLGSRYAEYIGWLVQETGNEQDALWWTQRAVALAAEAGDHDLASYGLVRRALVTLYRRDAEQTVGLAQRAQSSALPVRIRGLAAQREAQGHALAGDYDACMRSLERARTLLARHIPGSDLPVLGTTNLSDPAEMIRGWCLYDLGRPNAAAEVIEKQLAQVPAQAVRTRVRYGARQALACAAAGEIDHACALTHQLLDLAVAVDSATITTDLRDLARVLTRHPNNPSVRDLAPSLGPALRAISHR